jgi:uncharacterized membrane protein YbhN (UPF0104 family)
VLTTLVVPALLLRPIHPALPGLGPALAACAGGGAVILALATASARWRAPASAGAVSRAAASLADSVGGHLASGRGLAGAALASILLYGAMAAITALAIAAVGGSLPFHEVALLTPVIAFVSHLPVSVNGLGVAEAAIVPLFTQAG